MSSFTNSSLTDYVEEKKGELLHAAILGAQTLSYPIDIVTGVKYKETLNYVAQDAPFQAGGTCAFNASGSTTFTQKVITVLDLKVQDEWCPKVLEKKYTQMFLKPGVKQDELPLGKFLTDKIGVNIAGQMESAIWQGDTASGINNLKHFDGLIKTIDAAASLISATTTADITTSNIRTIIDEMYTLIPAAIINDPAKPLVLLMGMDTFRLLVLKLSTDNLYNYAVNTTLAANEIMYPGFNLKVIGLNGLNNITGTAPEYKDRMFLTHFDNLVFATDLENDMENYELWFSQDDRVIKYSVEWKAGVQVKFGGEVVSYKNT